MTRSIWILKAFVLSSELLVAVSVGLLGGPDSALAVRACGGHHMSEVTIE
jgi:hypothetical protein